MAHIRALADTTTVVFTMDKYGKLVKETPGIALKYKHFFESIYHHNKNRNDKFFHVDTTKHLALIIHNEMKSSLIAFVKRHIELINKFPLVATGTTGLILYKIWDWHYHAR